MKYLIVILVFLLGSVGAIDLTAPGVEGMISNGDLLPGQMRYAMNIDAWSRPGLLQRRQGLQHYGATQGSVTGFYGMFDPYWDRKLVIGVGDSTYLWYDGDLPKPTTVGQFFVSDTFVTNVVNGVSGYSFPLQVAHHDWTVCDGGLIHCDGGSLPMFLTTTSPSKHNDSTRDTASYAPRVMPLGLPAPGQLVVGNSGQAGPLTGAFVYSYAFLDSAATASTADDSTSALSIPSAPVTLNAERAYLSQFDRYYDATDLNTSGHPIIICRKELNSRDEWVVIDTVYPSPNDTNIYLAGRHPHSINSYYPSCYPACGGPYVLPMDDIHDNTASHRMWILNSDSTDADTVMITVGGDDSSSFQTWIDSVDCIVATDPDSGWGQIWECFLDSMVLLLNATGVTGDSIDVYHDGYTIWAIDSSDSLVPWTMYYQRSSGRYGYPGIWGNVYEAGYFWDTADGVEHEMIYIDTIAQASTPLFDDSRVCDTIHAPGQLFPDSLAAGYGTLNSYHAYDDSSYWVAYSYYDPLTGLESPRGPILAVELIDGLSGDTAQFRSLTTGIPASGRPTWIRLWQTTRNSTIAGAGDSLIWFALYDIRTEDTSQTIIWGGWPDYAVASNLEPDSIKTDTLYDYQMAWNVAGDQMSYRLYDNQLMFTETEWCYDRFWGIDQNRLYYSGVNDPADWSPFDFLRIDEGVDDELVAVKEVGGQLYPFKHHSVWLITGSNPQYDMIVEPYLTGIGVASVKALAKHRADLYFLTPDAELWSLRQGELSAPVADRMDSLFQISVISSHRRVADYGRVVPFNDKILVVNDSTSEVLTYWIDPGAWDPEVYASFTPMGSFYYDSSNIISGFGSSHLLWDSAGKPLMREYLGDTSFHDQSGTTEWAAEFYLGGNGTRYWQATDLKIELKAAYHRNWLRYSLRDQEDELATDSFYIKLRDTWRMLDWSLSPEQGTGLYLRLYSPTADSVSLEIDSTPTKRACRNAWLIDRLKVRLRDMGKPAKVGEGDDVDEDAGGPT